MPAVIPWTSGAGNSAEKNESAYATAGHLQTFDGRHVERPQGFGDHALETDGAAKLPVGIGGGGEPVGRPDAETCQGSPHLAQ